MRLLLAILLIAMVWPAHLQAQERLDSYRHLLEGYRNYDEKAANDLGDFWEMVERRGNKGIGEVIHGMPRELTLLSIMALTDLGMAALARGDRVVANDHLLIAQRWVNELIADHTSSEPMRRFARKWYIAMIWLRFARAEGPSAAKLLDIARAMFPADPEILLSSGTFEAMEISRNQIERGGKRRADRDERTNSYGLSASQVQVSRATNYFREAIKLDPKNVEARVRLAWLRFTTQSLDFSAALTLLKEARELGPAPKPPMSYLAALFAGRIEEELKHLDAASVWYRTAIAECPLAQTARLALSHVQLDQNEIVASRNTLRPLTGGPAKEDYLCEPDPWRMYEFGQAWRLTDWITVMRKEVREPAEGSQP